VGALQLWDLRSVSLLYSNSFPAGHAVANPSRLRHDQWMTKLVVPDRPESINDVADQIEQQLLALHGPLITGKPLAQALGYPSQDALRHDMARKQMPVRVFSMVHKRGKFALVREVALCIAAARCGEP
jgi:hypothetical protein